MCSYLREPIPGEVNLNLLRNQLTHAAESIKQAGGATTAFVHPSTWALLAQAGTVRGAHTGVIFEHDGRRIIVYPKARDRFKVDELRIRLESVTSAETKYIIPDFLTPLPGAAELYNQARKGGMGRTQALTTVTDTLAETIGGWAEDWFGHEGGQLWEYVTRSVLKHGITRATEADNALARVYDLAGPLTLDEDLLHSVTTAQEEAAGALAVWQRWAELAVKPGPCPFDPQRAVKQIGRTYTTADMGWIVGCRPGVYAHLAQHVETTDAGRHYTTDSGGNGLLLTLVDWADDDAVHVGLHGPSNNPATKLNTVYLAPREYTAAQAEAYEYARREGLNRKQAEEAALFTASSPHYISTRNPSEQAAHREQAAGS